MFWCLNAATPAQHGPFSRARSGAARHRAEVITARAPVCPRVIDELVTGARRVLEQYTNNSVEADQAGSRGTRVVTTVGCSAVPPEMIVARGVELIS